MAYTDGDDDNAKQDSARSILARSMASFTLQNDLMADELRLSTLAQIRIMDSEPEPEFDEIIALAALICDAPIATMEFIDDKRTFIKAKVGVDVVELPVGATLGVIPVSVANVVVIEDSLLDERVKDHPLVKEKSVRFFAGIPLTMPNGAVIGSLTVADDEPRHLSKLQLDSLEKLSRITVSLLAKRHP